MLTTSTRSDTVWFTAVTMATGGGDGEAGVAAAATPPLASHRSANVEYDRPKPNSYSGASPSGSRAQAPQ